MRRPPLPTMLRLAIAALAFGAGTTGVAAQDPAAGAPTTLRLTDAQKAELMSRNSEASVDAARAGLTAEDDLGPNDLGNGAPGRRIHGEVGAMIGSNGTRGAYGVAAVPLGDHADAVVSVESSRYGRPR